MKQSFLFIITCFVFLTSCNQKNDSQQKILSVSIEPQRYFLETIVGDRYKVNCVIPPGSNPESFDPTPSQMVSLGKSEAYFKVGQLSFENVWINNVKQNNPSLIIVDSSEGIEHLDSECHGHNHSHEGEDPHIWSSPISALKMVVNMYNAVIEIDPDNTVYYSENFDKLKKSITETDSIIKSYIDSSTNKTFIIYHPALSYLSDEYGLEQLSIEHNGKSPSPSQLKKLIDIAKAKDVKVVFIQEEYDVKNAETIAKEIGAKVLPINLLSYDWSNEMIKIAKAISGN